MKSTGVFISYRRAGGIETARNIHDRLTHLGFDVFMDLASMRRGKFNTQIYDEIEKADNFVLVLSKDSLNRCAETDDWVRLELEHAINHNKNIILVSKTDFQGFPSDLPESISEIRYIDLTPISEEYYEAFFLRLTERLIFSSSKNRKIIRKSIEKRRHAEYKKSADNEPKIKPLFSYPGALSIEESYATIPTKNIDYSDDSAEHHIFSLLSSLSAIQRSRRKNKRIWIACASAFLLLLISLIFVLAFRQHSPVRGRILDEYGAVLAYTSI